MFAFEYWQLKQLFPDIDANAIMNLQRKMMYDQFLKKKEEEKEAKQAGADAANAFTTAFEKELEKLFK